jgi:5'-phosphate synthase pdxT subunit
VTSIGPKVGVVAVQGAFREHEEALAALGATAVDVRVPSDLAGVDALVLPGGESTTMSLLLRSSGLWDEIAARLAEPMPVLATCAGLILLARTVVGGRDDQRVFSALDVTVARNAYGRQSESFEADLDVQGLDGGDFPAVFIRAPVITDAGTDVDVLARVDGQPVLVRQGSILAATFHPELSGDLRIHALFLGGT